MLATRHLGSRTTLALLAESMGADIEEVRKGMGSDPRIGYHFLYAGCGYGGSAVLPWKRRQGADPHRGGIRPRPEAALQAVEDANDAQKQVLVREDRCASASAKTCRGRRFAGLGPDPFKPGHRRHARKASARALIGELLARGATVTAYDPVATTEAFAAPSATEPRIAYAENPDAALEGADALG